MELYNLLATHSQLSVEQHYHEALKVAAQAAASRIDQVVSASSVPQGLKGHIAKYVDRRGKGGNLMGTLIALAFYSSGGNPEQEEGLMWLMAAFEALVLQHYLQNMIFDNKTGLWNEDPRRSVSLHVLAASLMREVQERCLEGVAPGARSQVRKCLVSAGEAIASGQWLEMTETIEDTLLLPKDQQEHFYLEKAKLLSGVAYGQAVCAGALCAGASEARANTLLVIGESAGTGLHVSNDLGDFAPVVPGSAFKFYQDQYADWKNRRVTAATLAIASAGYDGGEPLEALFRSEAYAWYKQANRASYKAVKALIYQLVPEGALRDAWLMVPRVIRSNRYLHDIACEGERLGLAA